MGGPNIVSPALSAESLRAYLPQCGYSDALLREDYSFSSGGAERTVQWAAFSQNPPDARSACLAGVNMSVVGTEHAATLRELGTPTLFGCHAGQLYWYQHNADATRLLDRIDARHVPNFFEEHRQQFAPSRIYQAKTSAKFIASRQLDFVDVGLMPLLEQASGERLGRMVESLVRAVHEALPDSRPSQAFARWLFQSVFWLLAARLLRDKRVPSFKTVDVSDPADVFDRVARHYNARAPQMASAAERRALAAAARFAAGFPSLINISTESLAWVYENTLVSAEAREALGTHSTPSWLVDYIVWQLAPWIEEIPCQERHVLEPACGHSAFLVASVRLLREFTTNDFDDKSRLQYLRDHIHGIEIDDFAREIGRLSLTLADVPNSNGWDLADVDMYAGNELAKRVRKAGVVLANPPFEDFTKKERRYYAKQPGLGIFHNNKAAELFARVVQNLPIGGVFGLIMPESVLASSEGRFFRTQLIRDFELREVCLLPDKLFENSEIESAVVLGRRRSPALNHSVYSRRVYDWDLKLFEERLEPSIESKVPQSSFLLRTDSNLRLPDMYEIWEELSSHPPLGQFVHIQKGFEFKGGQELAGRTVISDQRKKGWLKAYLRADDDYSIYTTPTPSWIDYSKETIRRTGALPDGPQVLLNYSRVSRTPWRLKATVDMAGAYFSRYFLVFRPTSPAQLSLQILWAILNSPIANAYAFSVTSKRNLGRREWHKFPLPLLSDNDIKRIGDAAGAYREAAIRYNANSNGAGITEQTVIDLLMRMDAEVLRVYALRPDLEQQMLALFDVVERPGVGCRFTSYPHVPTSVHLPLHLRIQLPRFHELIALRLAGTLTDSQDKELKTIEESFDDYEMRSADGSAFRRWLKEVDRRDEHIRRRLDAIESRIAGRNGGSRG
jgi:hypothetical protein